MSWQTSLLAAGSWIVLRCLATSTKTVILHCSRYLPLVKRIR